MDHGFRKLAAGAASLVALAGCGGGGGSSSSAPPAPPPGNAPPAVDAGDDFAVNEGADAELQGSVTDPDSTVTVSWTQTAGPAVALSDSSVLNPSFTAPDVTADTALTFRLTADDGSNPAVSDDVEVTVRDTGVVIVTLTPAARSDIDHEVHPHRPELVFQSDGELVVGAVDPQSGLFANADGIDRRIDTQITPLDQARNGPEYGIDAGGVDIFYNRTNGVGDIEIWRASEDGAGGYTLAPVGPQDGVDRINQLPSRNAQAASTRLAYARIDNLDAAPDPIGSIAWLDEAGGAETDLTAIRPGFAGFRWLDGGDLLATTLADGPDEGEIEIIDVSDGSRTVVTDDFAARGEKFDPYPWLAPEFGDALAVIAALDDSDIGVYTDTDSDGLLELTARMAPPPESGLTFIQSPEPFIYDGKSYIVLTLKDVDGPIATDVNDAQIWIYGLEADAEGFPAFRLRCDDGAPNGVRSEGEARTAEDGSLHVYYNELRSNGRWAIVLCRAGVIDP